MKPVTFEDIKNMSEEERSELNKKLAIKGLTRFALIMGAKWAVIFGMTYAARKLLTSKTDTTDADES